MPAEDALHFIVKTKFERLVELVENKESGRINVDVVAVDVVEQATRSADND